MLPKLFSLFATSSDIVLNFWLWQNISSKEFELLDYFGHLLPNTLNIYYFVCYKQSIIQICRSRHELVGVITGMWNHVRSLTLSFSLLSKKVSKSTICRKEEWNEFSKLYGWIQQQDSHDHIWLFCTEFKVILCWFLYIYKRFQSSPKTTTLWWFGQLTKTRYKREQDQNMGPHNLYLYSYRHILSNW